MASSESAKNPKQHRRRRVVAIFFACWSTFVVGVLFNQFRTQDVSQALLETGQSVDVVETSSSLVFRPKHGTQTALLFFCGSGVEAPAYAPLLRPIADQGYLTLIVKLPGRFAMLPGQKEEALLIGQRLMQAQPGIKRWVISGHSLGAALSCKFVQQFPKLCSGLVLVGTTHPKEDDLSSLTIPVTKIYGSNDGVAPIKKVEANRRLLPAATQWIRIAGANHSQFGNYGHQLQDGSATVSREAQQTLARQRLLEMLKRLDSGVRKPRSAAADSSYHQANP